MGVILVLARFLAHPVKALAQAVALGQQQLALLGVQRHGVEGFLQLQARFADAFVLQARCSPNSSISSSRRVRRRSTARPWLCRPTTGLSIRLVDGPRPAANGASVRGRFPADAAAPQVLQFGFQGLDRRFALFARPSVWISWPRASMPLSASLARRTRRKCRPTQ
jgi:hypothetical protein